jgi:L-iditol 2-dehydrogenase
VGAILEPLGVAIHATRRANLPTGSTVLVFGAGAVGLLMAAMAKISGASTVIIADIDSGRVEFAVKNAFAHKGYTVPMRRGASIEENLNIAKETAAEVGKLQKSSGQPVVEVDAVFECTGVPSCLQAAIYVSHSLLHLILKLMNQATRPGGRVMLIGMGTPIQTLPISAAALREVDLVGVFRYANTYPTGIAVVSKKGPDYPDFSKLVTHRYKGLESAVEAFDMAGNTKDVDGKLVIKVVIETDDEDKARL